MILENIILVSNITKNIYNNHDIPAITIVKNKKVKFTQQAIIDPVL